MNQAPTFGGNEMPPQQGKQSQEATPVQQSPFSLEIKDNDLKRMYSRRQATESMFNIRGEAYREVYTNELARILLEIESLGGSEEGFIAYKKNKVVH